MASEPGNGSLPENSSNIGKKIHGTRKLLWRRISVGLWTIIFLTILILLLEPVLLQFDDRSLSASTSFSAQSSMLKAEINRYNDAIEKVELSSVYRSATDEQTRYEIIQPEIEKFPLVADTVVRADSSRLVFPFSCKGVEAVDSINIFWEMPYWIKLCIQQRAVSYHIDFRGAMPDIAETGEHIRYPNPNVGRIIAAVCVGVILLIVMVFFPFLSASPAGRAEVLDTLEILREQHHDALQHAALFRNLAMIELLVGVLTAVIGIFVFAYLFSQWSVDVRAQDRETRSAILGWIAVDSKSALMSEIYGADAAARMRNDVLTVQSRDDRKSYNGSRNEIGLPVFSPPPPFSSSNQKSPRPPPTIDELLRINETLVKNEPTAEAKASFWDGVNWSGIMRASGIFLAIEAVAWFLLRQYRSLMDDYKEFHYFALRRANYVTAQQIATKPLLNSGDIRVGEIFVLSTLLTEKFGRENLTLKPVDGKTESGITSIVAFLMEIVAKVFPSRSPGA